jgi:hypothetical protein
MSAPGLLALGLGLAAAATPVLVSTEGAVHPGDEVPLELAGVRDGPPDLSAASGSMAGRPQPLGDGRWRVRFRAPTAPGEARLLLATTGAPVGLGVPIEPWPAPAVSLPKTRPLTVGAASGARVPLSGATDAMRLVGPEGETTREADALVWRPGPDPFPRAVPLLLHDPSDPGLPASTVVLLRARPRLPVRTEPGTRVTVQIGRRTYGPVVAGADGVAQASAEVRPGETTATLLLEDAAGNVQRSSLNLGGAPRPALAALAEARLPGQERAPRVHLHAVEPSGRPWTGAPPACVTSLGARARVVSVSPGRWTATVPRQPDDEAFAVRVDCTVGGVALATVRIPAPPPRPASLDLRLSPGELPADVPRAAVRVALLGAEGDRLPAAGIELEAELGTLEEVEPGPGVLRAVYAGDAAVAAGADTLVARWSPPAGTGPVRALLVSGERDAGADHATVHARALDAVGRPLAGVPVAIQLGEAQVLVETDAQGWATAAVPASGPVVVPEARASGVVRRLTLPADTLVGPEPGRADLEARVRVPIRTGQVRRVFLSTDPGTLVLTGVERARVIVRLEDQDGNPVADPSLRLVASEGVVTRPRRRTDGTYEALWAPPPGMSYGRVRIAAESGDGSFAATSTDLDVVPREARRAPGFAMGWLAGPRGVSSPFLRVSGDLRLPVGGGRVYGRAWVGLYGEQAATTDVTGLDVAVDLALVPIGIGAATRQERGRLAGWFGASFVLAPYRLEAQVGDAVPARGLGWANPGFELGTGGGWRLRGGELTVDLGYLFLSTTPDGIGWRGPVGGFVSTLGYRLLF